MSALTTRRFLKMNGLGNEITVLDLRGSTARVSAAEARAIAADPRSHFDQLMVLHDPLTPGTDAFMRIYNTDGTESGACGNGTRCVAWAMTTIRPCAARSSDGLVLETKSGLLPVERRLGPIFTVDMGAPRFAWNEIPLARSIRRHPHRSPSSRCPSAPELAEPFGGEHGQSARDLLGADAASYDLPRHRPDLRKRSGLSASAPISRWRRFSRPIISCFACGSAAPASRAPAGRPPARPSLRHRAKG